MRYAWAIVVAALVMVAGPGAASARPRVAVIGDAAVSKAVRGALGKKVELVEVGRGEALPLAAEHRLAAVVVIEVHGSKKKATAEVTLLQGADGKLLASYQVKGKRAKLGKLAAAKAWKKLGKAIGKARAPKGAAAEPVTVAAAEPARAPPAEPPEERAAPTTAVAEASPSPPPPSRSRSEEAIGADVAPARPRSKTRWLTLTADGRPFLRTLRYKDDIEGRLRPYDLAAPAAGITATWVPRPRGAARFFALRGELELAVGVNGSRTDSGMEFATSSSEWSAGIRADLPVAGWRVMIDAAYGEHRFAVDDDAMPEELVPDVTYRMVRGVLTVSVPVKPTLSIDAGGGWRQLLGTGDLGGDAWFPRATGAGIEAELGATWRAARSLELFARADLRRYFFSMHPEVGDDLVVGGAVDQYLAVIAGLSVSLR